MPSEQSDAAIQQEETTNEKGDRIENEAVHILSCTYGRGNVDKCQRYGTNDPLRFIDILAVKEGFPIRFVQVKANQFTAKQKRKYGGTVSRFPDDILCEVWVRIDYEGWEIWHWNPDFGDWDLFMEINTCDRSEAVEPFRKAAGYYEVKNSE